MLKESHFSSTTRMGEISDFFFVRKHKKFISTLKPPAVGARAALSLLPIKATALLASMKKSRDRQFLLYFASSWRRKMYFSQIIIILCGSRCRYQWRNLENEFFGAFNDGERARERSPTLRHIISRCVLISPNARSQHARIF